jgi:hypothetical protein
MTMLVLALTFAFHYEQPLTEAQVKYFSRFDVFVTHDPLPPPQVTALREAGTKLFVYEWAVAFYDSRATKWERSLIGTKAVLNARPLRGGAGSNEADAWYFDPLHASDRARRLAEIVRGAGYDGVFLDTTTAANVHPRALREFTRRHPGIDYDAAYARFLAKLGEEHILIFTNQGYRNAPHYLPYADWDLTESLIAARPWTEVRAWFERLPRQDYPRLQFAHLEYADATRTVAIARMFGAPGYVPGTESPLYFADLGDPCGPRVDEGDASYRLFEKGVVAVNDSKAPLRIPGWPQVVEPGQAVVWTNAP